MGKDDYRCPNCNDVMINDDGKLVCLRCYTKKPAPVKEREK